MIKIAIVTGDSSGIGRATAKALADMGCTVYGFSRRGCDLPGIRHLTVDVTSEEGVLAAVEHVAQREGRIDILVNCAGFGISGAVEFTELSAAKRQFDVNLFGTVNMVKAVLPHMRRTGEGRIVNISSVAAVAHIPFQTFYSATKAAVESYSQALANEIRPFGITVTCAQPGDIRTGFTQARQKSPLGDDIYGGRISKSVAGMERDEEKGMSPETVGRFIAKLCLRRRVRPVHTVGLGYQCLSLLCKLLPNGLRNRIVGLIYG